MGALPLSPNLFVGCYTSASPVGLRSYHGADSGELSPTPFEYQAPEASFLTVRPDTDTLYAVSETVAGTVAAYRVSSNGLTKIDEVSSYGDAPCYVSTHAGRLYVANYVSGSVCAYALAPDGSFGELIGVHQFAGSGPHPRQESSHAHCILPAPDGSVYVTDLGADQIVRFVDRDDQRFVADVVSNLAPGMGPRHLAFHPTAPFALIVGELDCTLVLADVDPATGQLNQRQTVSTLPDGARDEALAAEVALHPDGHRVYVSTRGYDNIATFALDTVRGSLDVVDHTPSGGRTPRHIAVEPNGRYLYAAHQDSNSIVVFTIDQDGVPQQTAVVDEISQPVCLAFTGGRR